MNTKAKNRGLVGKPLIILVVLLAVALTVVMLLARKVSAPREESAPIQYTWAQ